MHYAGFRDCTLEALNANIIITIPSLLQFRRAMPLCRLEVCQNHGMWLPAMLAGQRWLEQRGDKEGMVCDFNTTNITVRPQRVYTQSRPDKAFHEL